MAPKHSREDARTAKREALALFQGDGEVTSIGIGLSDGDYVVTLTVTHRDALKKLPDSILDVPVQASVSGEFQKLLSR